MNCDQKRRFIKDPIWGNIELLPWEVELLNHFLVNRLHNVVQNSTAYKVYPGLKYSRFVHSIGVLHVVTQIFSNIVLNSPLEALEALKAENAEVERGLYDNYKNEVTKIVCDRISFSGKFPVLLSALRLGAILHDIGHLPYSHAFEHAIEAFLDGNYQCCIPPTNEAEAIRKRLKDLLPDQRAQEVKVHERLGKGLFELLQDEFKGSQLVRPLVEGAVELLYGEKCPISKSILVGTVDSDRIDFVRRDGLFSGLFVSSVDYGRLFAMYELAKQPNGKWHARPSCRGTSEAEKLIWERFQDYCYIISHHRVHLFDEILERLLLRLMAEGELMDFLGNLEQLLRFSPPTRIADKKDNVKLLESLHLSFDDSWLDVQLRNAYTKAKKNNAEIHKVRLFEAYAEDRDYFKSVFKRDSEFWERCKEVAPFLSISEAPTFAIKVRQKKYVLEHQIYEKFNVLAIVGDMAKKITHGIADDDTAQFFGLEELKDFLSGKIRKTKLFNLWYVPPRDDGKTEIYDLENKMLSYILEQISDQQT